MKRVHNFIKQHYFSIGIAVCAGIVFALGLLYTYYCFVVPNSKTEQIYIRADRNKEEYKDLPSGEEVTQHFSLEDQTLSTVKVWFRKNAEAENDKLMVSLYREGSGEPIQNWELLGSDIGDNQFHSFTLDSPVDVNEKSDFVIKLYIESASDMPGLHLVVTGEDEYMKGSFTISGEKQNKDLCFEVSGGDNQYLSGMYIIVLLYLVLIAGIFVFGAYKKHWKPETIFAFLCVSLGIIHWFLMPTYTTPDEKAHFATTYYYSSELLGTQAVDDQGNVLVRACDSDFSTSHVYPTNDTYAYISDHFFETSDDETMISYKRGPLNVAFFAFLPQIIGVTIARLLHFGGVPLMFLGSMFGLLFYAICTFFAVKFMPFGKMIVATIALLPMIMETAASFSYDVVLNSLSFLFIGYTFYLAYKKDKITWKDWVFEGIVLALLSPIKVVYILLGLMCVLIPAKKCPSRKSFIISLTLIFAAGMGLILLTRMSSVASLVQNSGDKVDYFDLDYIAHNISRTISTIYNTFREVTDAIWMPVFGRMLGTWNVEIPWYIFIGFLGIVFCASIAPAKEIQYFKKKDRMVFALVISGIMAGVGLALLLDFTPVNAGHIKGIQGRYFYPVLPLMFLIIRNKKIVVNKELSRELFAGMFLLNYFTLWRIFETVVAR